MAMQDTIDALKKVSEIAALAGLKGRINDELQRFEMGFELDGGRSQMVYVRYLGKAPGGKDAVTFFSPARAIPKGFLKGMSKETAIELLRLNSQVFFARFGIWEQEKEVLVVASIDALLDTLDPDEFHANAWSTAVVADKYEREHGKDDF